MKFSAFRTLQIGVLVILATALTSLATASTQQDWYPKGYQALHGDSSMALKWGVVHTCTEREACTEISRLSKKACPGGISYSGAEFNSSGIALWYNWGSTEAVSAGKPTKTIVLKGSLVTSSEPVTFGIYQMICDGISAGIEEKKFSPPVYQNIAMYHGYLGSFWPRDSKGANKFACQFIQEVARRIDPNLANRRPVTPNELTISMQSGGILGQRLQEITGYSMTEGDWSLAMSCLTWVSENYLDTSL